MVAKWAIRKHHMYWLCSLCCPEIYGKQADRGGKYQSICKPSHYRLFGYAYLCHVLSRYGYTDVAYTLLLQNLSSSLVISSQQKGATTIGNAGMVLKQTAILEAVTMNSV